MSSEVTEVTDYYLITEARTRGNHVIGLIRKFEIAAECLDDWLLGYHVPKKEWGSDFFRFGSTLVRWDKVR